MNSTIDGGGLGRRSWLSRRINRGICASFGVADLGGNQLRVSYDFSQELQQEQG